MEKWFFKILEIGSYANEWTPWVLNLSLRPNLFLSVWLPLYITLFPIFSVTTQWICGTPWSLIGSPCCTVTRTGSLHSKYHLTVRRLLPEVGTTLSKYGHKPSHTYIRTHLPKFFIQIRPTAFCLAILILFRWPKKYWWYPRHCQLQ